MMRHSGRSRIEIVQNRTCNMLSGSSASQSTYSSRSMCWQSFAGTGGAGVVPMMTRLSVSVSTVGCEVWAVI